MSSFMGQRVSVNVASRPVTASRLVTVAKDSRIGKKPITVPKGVTVTIADKVVSVKGPKGELAQTMPAGIAATLEGEKLTVNKLDASRKTYQLHGLSRSLINNMVVGVVGGFEKKMTLVGVGYRGKVDGRKLVLTVGYTHDLIVELPAGINAAITGNVNLSITGIDKEKVGNFAASLRLMSPPEPYGGKGIRFADEVIKLKEGKTKGKK